MQHPEHRRPGPAEHEVMAGAGGADGRDGQDLERGDVLPTRARLERLLEWVAPVAEEIGAAPYLTIPERNAAERQLARFEEGATLPEIYAEQVGVPVRG